MFEENIQDSSSDKVIFTDHEITKSHIWTAYEGLKSFYSNWDMNRLIGRDKRYLTLGLHKHIKEFILQIKFFLEDKKISEDIKGSTRALKILTDTTTDNKPLSDDDIHFIRFFAEDFLAAAGMKNISRNVSKVPIWLR